MKKILLVKTSSMGDVVHNLPAASDIAAAEAQCEVHWVVEESFVAIPRLHSSVKRVLPVAIRRWRSGWWRSRTRAEISAFMRELKGTGYDAVIDTQGLLKSALVARIARGMRYGLDWESAREPLGLFYNRTFSVPWKLHAVERNRALAAQALGYAPRNGVDYGIRAPRGAFQWLPAGRYAVLLHGTSARRKLWSETSWIELGRRLTLDGSRCVLPWGSSEEYARSERLAQRIPGALVPPEITLAEVAALLAGAGAVAGVDTGLTHLAGALRAPTVGIYCATDPAATGLYGCARAVNIGGPGSSPAAGEVIAALERLVARNE
jgi:heptosyltransferase-1